MNQERGFVQQLKSEILKKGLLTQKEFGIYEREAEQTNQSLVEILFSSCRIMEKELLHVLSRILGYPPVSVTTFTVSQEILNLIPRELARRYQVLPVSKHEKTLTVAISDPTNLPALDDLAALAGLRIRPALAVPSQLKSVIQKCYGNGSKVVTGASGGGFEAILEEIRSQMLQKPGSRGLGDLSDLLEMANATPIVRLVNHLLIEAIRRKASDVFVEPLEKSMRVRYRVDGVLEQILKTPKAFLDPVVSRIKVMSRLNIAEHRVPQDGRFKARIFGPEVDLRVSILPTCYGEKACLRILDPSAETHRLDKLGFTKSELEIIGRNALKPHGMILVTGPTGSGKTTTLYAILQHLNSPEKNITTVEDPVEYQVSGINQVNARESVGLTFPVALRSILRQDPDIILIGEIRDQVTMDIAIKAALTGHLVLSTLHTNDATSAIVRMVNMGIEPFLIASSVLMISAQRLVRRLCSFCRVAYKPENQLLQSLELEAKRDYTFYRPKGCDRCGATGYKGRIVISELFEIRPSVMELISRGGSNDELRNLARELGMKTLRENGVEKVKEGVTSVEEVCRTTSPERSGELQKA